MKQSFVIMVMLLCTFQQGFSQQKVLSSFVKKDVSMSERISSDYDLVSPAESKKSVLLAVVASLLIPGMGELYAGSFESGKYHLLAEGGLWLTYAGFRRYSNWIGQDARNFASQNAQADFNNKDDQYSVNIGNFNTTKEYNQAKARNREYNLMYQSSDYTWDWGGSEANRLRFRELRIRSAGINNNAKFVIAAVVVNHIFSAFSAGRKAAAYNQSLSSSDNIQIRTYALNTGNLFDGIGLSLTTSF